MSKKNKGMHLHYRKDRDCWEIREFVGGKRKRHATGFSSRKDAEEKLAELLIQKTPIKKASSIGQILTYYTKEHIPTISRPDVALANLERIIPFWATMTLEEICKSKSLEYYEYRKREYIQWQKMYGQSGSKILSASSVRRELEQLQAAITFAYKQNVIEHNPFIWKPEKSKSRTRWLTRKEAANLILAARKSDQASDYLPLFILIGVYTGARMTAILKLRWTDVDLDNGIIDFTTNDLSEKKKGAKTRIPPRLIRRLRAHKKRGVEMGYVLHKNQEPIKNPKKSFKTACKKAGLEDVTIHTLRHTCASWLIQNNVSPAKIAKHLGHTSSRMIEQTYGHLSESHLEEIMEVFG